MFAILFEVLLIEIQGEIPLSVGMGGELRGTKIVNRNFVNKRAFRARGYFKIERCEMPALWTLAAAVWPLVCERPQYQIAGLDLVA